MPQKATAQLKYLHMAPRKVRLVASLLCGMHVNEARAQLGFQPQRAAGPITKLLKSAIANARQLQLNPDRLIISDIHVDQGPMAKRMMPRAMGRGVAIQKKMSHISITLMEGTKVAPAYVFVDLPKKKKNLKDKKAKKSVSKNKENSEENAADDRAREHKHENQAVGVKRSKPLTGFAQKFFRRKAGGE